MTHTPTHQEQFGPRRPRVPKPGDVDFVGPVRPTQPEFRPPNIPFTPGAPDIGPTPTPEGSVSFPPSDPRSDEFVGPPAPSRDLSRTGNVEAPRDVVQAPVVTRTSFPPGGRDGQFDLNFTQDIAEGIRSGELFVSDEVRREVLQGRFNTVDDISQVTLTQQTGATGIAPNFTAFFQSLLGSKLAKKFGVKALSKFGQETSKQALKRLGSTQTTLEGIVKSTAKAGAAKRTLKEAARIGTKIDDAGGLVNVGDKFGPMRQAIKNSRQAKLVNDIILNNAKKISPFNWKKLIGISAGALGIGTVVSASLWSGFSLRNSYSDIQQQLGIMRSNLLKAGDIEGAREVQDLAEDNTFWYNELNHVFSNPFRAAEGVGRFVDFTVKANDVLEASILDKKDKDIIRDEADVTYSNYVLEQNLTAQEIVDDDDLREFADNPNNTFTRVAKIYNDAVAAVARQATFDEADAEKEAEQAATDQKFADIAEQKKADDAARDAAFKAREEAQQAEDEAKTDVERDILRRGQDLIDRILNDQMTATEIFNDPEIRRFALDPNNQFSPLRDIYDQASAAIAREGFGGPGDGGRTINEAPSTLGFGLLQTGGETRQADEGIEQPDIQSLNLNTVAQELFGIAYSELTPSQKAIVDKEI